MPRSTAEATDKKRKIAQLLRQRTTWTCNVCTYENPPSKFKCKICETPKPSKRRESAQICPIIENQALRKKSRLSRSPTKIFSSKEKLKSSEIAESLERREGTTRYAKQFVDGNPSQKSPRFNDSRVSETKISSNKIQENFSSSTTAAISKEKEDFVKSLNDDTKNRNSYEKRKEIKSNNLQNQTFKIKSLNDDEQIDQENGSPIIESKYFKSNRVNISSSISSLLSSSNTSNDTVNGDKSMSSLEKDSEPNTPESRSSGLSQVENREPLETRLENGTLFSQERRQEPGCPEISKIKMTRSKFDPSFKQYYQSEHIVIFKGTPVKILRFFSFPDQVEPSLKKAPFECVICGERKSKTHLLEKHYDEYHNPKVHRYPCHLCGEKFHEEKNLRIHFSTTHPKKEDPKPRSTQSSPGGLSTTQENSSGIELDLDE